MSSITIYSIISGSVFQSNACNRITDMILIVFTLGGLGFGAISWFIIDNITDHKTMRHYCIGKYYKEVNNEVFCHSC